MEITKRHSGASFPQVYLDGKYQPATKILGDSLLGGTGIIDQLMIERPAVGLAHTTDANGDWHSVNTVDVRKNGIYVPSLAELGFPTGYELKGAAAVTCYPPVGIASDIEIRLLEYPTDTLVPDSGATKAVSSDRPNQFLKADFVPIEGGKTYMLDFKSGVGQTVNVRVMSLFIQIVKK